MKNKICTRCAIAKPIKEYQKYQRKDRLYVSYMSICKECKRAKDREYVSNLTPEQKAHRNKYSKKYRQTDKYKQFLNNYQPKYSGVKSRDICFIVCVGCGKKETLKCKASDRTKCYTCSARHHYHKAKPPREKSNCVTCGQALTGHQNKKYCSKKCAPKVSGNIRRRTKRHRAYYKPIKKLKVFDRDKWRCQICFVKVQKKNIYTSNAAELDHIVPLSKGGPHTYSNVQTLCRACNQTKSNTYKGQLILNI